ESAADRSSRCPNSAMPAAMSAGRSTASALICSCGATSSTISNAIRPPNANRAATVESRRQTRAGAGAAGAAAAGRHHSNGLVVCAASAMRHLALDAAHADGLVADAHLGEPGVLEPPEDLGIEVFEL